MHKLLRSHGNYLDQNNIETLARLRSKPTGVIMDCHLNSEPRWLAREGWSCYLGMVDISLQENKFNGLQWDWIQLEYQETEWLVHLKSRNWWCWSVLKNVLLKTTTYKLDPIGQFVAWTWNWNLSVGANPADLFISMKTLLQNKSKRTWNFEWSLKSLIIWVWISHIKGVSPTYTWLM